MEDEEETDESVLDWWSKYFASIETLKEVCVFCCVLYQLTPVRSHCLLSYIYKDE